MQPSPQFINRVVPGGRGGGYSLPSPHMCSRQFYAPGPITLQGAAGSASTPLIATRGGFVSGATLPVPHPHGGGYIVGPIHAPPFISSNGQMVLPVKQPHLVGGGARLSPSSLMNAGGGGLLASSASCGSFSHYANGDPFKSQQQDFSTAGAGSNLNQGFMMNGNGTQQQNHYNETSGCSARDEQHNKYYDSTNRNSFQHPNKTTSSLVVHETNNVSSSEASSSSYDTLYDQVKTHLQALKHIETSSAAQKEGEYSILTRLMTELQRCRQQLRSRASNADQPTRAPSRRGLSVPPPFFWDPCAEYSHEFSVEGRNCEKVTKIGDFEDQGWVIPVGGSLRMHPGGVFMWAFKIVKKSTHRPQLQFGVHGVHHDKPWRLVTTSRCSRSRDDEPWIDRPDGDRMIDEGDLVTVQVDMRGTGTATGTFSYAVNEGKWEMAFDDLPLSTNNQSDNYLIPVVSMGGNGCSVELQSLK